MKQININITLSELFFYLSLASVVASIIVWCGGMPGVHPTMAKMAGIFVGLWAPTLMSLSNRYKDN
jgi:hypothetical protein